LVELLGDKLLVSDGVEVNTSEALAGKGAVAIYFSGHWCPPCRGFTPKLAEWYNAHLKAKGLEIVFVSSDKDEGGFKEYFGDMPWLALPFSDRARKGTLDKKFKVSGIPTVVILDTEGNVITKDGVAALGRDPKGEEFPWKPKSLQEILTGAKIIGKEGETASLEGKAFALYFSAHWCPPCRGFTPKFAEMYSNHLKAKGLEVVFVSSDKDEAAFKDYYAEMPWLALDYSCRKEKEQLSNLFEVQGIPSLVIIGEDGGIITKDGRAAVTNDPEGAEFPLGWYPKPVKDLADGPGPLNEAVCVIAFCEASGVDAAKAAEAAMEVPAKKFIAEAKAKAEDPEVSFLIAKTSGGISRQLRTMTGLTALPPPKHEHTMEKVDGNGGRWGCDGCGKGGPDAFADVQRFRCSAGCDYDYCQACNEKAEAGGGGDVMPPKLVLLNIPDDGAFFEGPEGELTSENVEKFVSDFKAGSLTKRQLQK